MYGRTRRQPMLYPATLGQDRGRATQEIGRILMSGPKRSQAVDAEIQKATGGNSALAQALMAKDPNMKRADRMAMMASDTSPVQHPLQGMARLLQGYGARTLRNEAETQATETADRQNEAIQSLGIALPENFGDLPQGMQSAYLASALQGPEKDPLVEVYDEATGGMRFVRQSQAEGMLASGPEAADAGPLKEVWDPQQGAMVYLPESQAVGMRASAPEVGGGPEYEYSDPYQDEAGNWVQDKTLDGLIVDQVAVEGRTVMPESTGPDPTELRGWSNDFDKDVAPFVEQASAYQRLENIFDNKQTAGAEYIQAARQNAKFTDAIVPEDQQAAADIALIFAFMKTIDPGSTVREGEFATAQNAGNLSERLKAQYNSLLRGGGRLTDEQRQGILIQANRAYGQAQADFKSVRSRYEDRMSRLDMDPSLITYDLYQPRFGFNDAPRETPQPVSQNTGDGITTPTATLGAQQFTFEGETFTREELETFAREENINIDQLLEMVKPVK